MTTNQNPIDDTTLDDIAAASQSASERMRAWIDSIEQSRDTQPERLVQARAEADEARGWALIEEPFETQVSALRAYTRDGQPTGNATALPNLKAKTLFGARLAFDMLDAGGEDYDRVEEVQSRYFAMVGGDPGLAFLLFAEALELVAALVVPQLLEDLEQHGNNYDARVMLAEARTKAWRDRVANHEGAPYDPDAAK